MEIVIFYIALISAGSFLVNIVSVALFGRRHLAIYSVFIFLAVACVGILFNLSYDFAQLFPDVALYRSYIDGSTIIGDDTAGSAGRYAFVFRPIFELGLRDPLAFVVIQILIFELSTLFIVRTVYSLGDVSVNRAFFVTEAMLHIYPSAIIYVFSNLREYAIIFSTAIFVLSLSSSGRVRSTLLVAASTTLFFVIRPFYIIASLASFLISRAGQWKIYAALAAVAGAPVAFYLLRGHAFSLDWLFDVRSQRLSIGDSAVYDVERSGFLPFDIAALYAQFMLAPLPILHEHAFLHMRFFLTDLVYVLGVTIVALFAWARSPKRYAPFICAFLALSVLPAVWEAYIGGAVRHRMPAIIMLIVIAAHWLSSRSKRTVK